MSQDTPSKPTKICPTCGSRVSEDATRCLVCGSDLGRIDDRKASKGVQGSRMPSISISLPAALGLLALFLAIGAGLVYFTLGQTSSPEQVSATATATITVTPSPSLTPTGVTPTITSTPEPSPTPLSYTVKLGDTCGGIAFAFNVTTQSIVLLNNLPADCGTGLIEGMTLLIPHPTPTPSPQPSATLSAEEATVAARPTLGYTVQENDTLSSISLNYAVSVDSIKQWNGLVNNVVRFGQTLIIPLCERTLETPTPTIPAPYSAPSLLLPPDGAPFFVEDGQVSLQWASVGTLRDNESYEVTIEDVTEGEGRKLVEYVIDTKFLIPDSFLIYDNIPHVLRWWVTTVRQVDTDEDGNPVWDSAGGTSMPRVFTWTGTSGNQTP